MYTKQQVDEMLSQVEQEFENALGSIIKSEENIEEEVEVETTEELEKSESEEEIEEDYETIDDLYASMTKSEREAHYTAVKKSLFGEVEEQSMEKSEKVEAKEDKEVEMLKSENEELKKNYEQLNELVNQLFNTKKAPAQKAVTNINYIAKSEETQVEEKEDFSKMSKSEVTAKLKAIDYSELKKSDREAINNYYLDNGSVESIKHLIRE